MKPLENTVGFLRRIFTNPSFLIYLAAFAAMLGLLEIFRTLVRQVNAWMNVDTLTVAGDVAVLLLPLVFLRPRWRRTVWFLIAGMTVFCYVNLWYCRAFYDLMPADSLGMGGNMQSRVIDAFFDQLRMADWLLLLPVAAFAAVWLPLRRKALTVTFPLSAKITLTAVALLLYGGAYMARAYRLYDVNRKLGDYPHMLCNYFRYSKVKAYKFTQHLTRMGYIGYM
ncbi:MAG: hypothetical protein K2P06_01875, partial [Muribaculaceae bacterium]|nr:hypothetical protein [Muribaculaceae bacterium]